MPELPDVEGYRRLMQAHVLGQAVRGITVLDAGVIRECSERDFVRRLTGQLFDNVERKGKWLCAYTNGPTLLIHFGMTGSVVWNPHGEAHRYDKVVFEFELGDLVYRDQRKLRGLWLAESETAVDEVVGPHGPDALDLRGQWLIEVLERHRGGLKSLLMNQHVVAGLGNMLSDEILWRAKIHPGTHFDQLDSKERRTLDRSLQSVLRASVRQGRIPRTRTWLSSQRSVEEPRCPRCSGKLQTSRIASRTSYWCPVCQPAARQG